MRPPSLRDVAARAGTSTAVVSYVINDGPRPVAPATRQRVEEAIASLGYRPNALARGLRTQRTSTLGLVVPDLSKPFFAEIAAAIEDAAKERAYRLLVSSTRFDVHRETEQVGALLDARVDGVIVVPAGNGMPAAGILATARAPTVIAYRSPDALAMADGPVWSPCFVATDDEGAGRAAAEHLAWHGWRHYACLAGPPDRTPVGRRARGFGAGVPAAIVECAYDDLATNAYRATLHLLADTPEIDAICATTDDHALGAMRAIAESGRTLGSDIGLVAIGGSALTHFLTPPLTVLRTPVTEFGRQCVDSLQDLIDGVPVEPPTPLPMPLVARTSCGC